eukprot:GHUV01021721.1.p1 GENE.GHUV01021721.1~~GHUV01021721.1.p1  ORF type:complete len:384 (+),score=70.66 GHUV01021721.1:223-1374(+)
MCTTALQETPDDQFDATPSCRAVPTAATSSPDAIGRLWGWRHNSSCAFKDVAGHVLFYTDYTPASWLHTPACTDAPFPEDSVADNKFKVWDWTGEGRQKALCAFKTDSQQPIPIDRHLYRLTWMDAPACVEEPEPTSNNSVPDKAGCLYGWQLDRNCAYKTQTHEPVYYDGYKLKCNTTAYPEPVGADDAGYAGDFGVAEGDSSPQPSDQAAGEEGNDAPGAITSVGQVRQKAPEKDLSETEVNDLFSSKVKNADLNKTITLSDDSSDDNTPRTDDTGSVSDTPVPVAFGNDPSSADAPVPSPNPTNASPAAQNSSKNGAVVADTPVPVIFNAPVPPAGSARSAPAQRRHLHATLIKPQVRCIWRTVYFEHACVKTMGSSSIS